MKNLAREIIAGGAAVGTLGATSAAAMPFAATVVTALVVYAGLRLALPADPPESPAAAPDQELVNRGREAVQALHEAHDALPDGSFRTDVRRICDSLTQLLSDPQHGESTRQLDRELPQRIEQLRTMVERYANLIVADHLSEAARAALTQTEYTFARARERFESLLQRRLDQAAIELKIDGRVYDELMDIQFGTEKI